LILLLSAPAFAQDMPDPFFGPPEKPDPWRGKPKPMPPLSTSGTDLVAPMVHPQPGGPGDVGTQRRLRVLEARIQALEAQKKESSPSSLAWWASHLRLSAFVQPQFVAQLFNAQASPNLGANGTLPSGIGANDTFALANGDTTNAIFFRMRRARLRLEADLAEWKPNNIPMVRLVFEMEPIPRTRNIVESGSILRQTEAQFVIPWSCHSRDKCALATTLAMGLMRVPFGFELLEAETSRPFAERSFGAQSMFPGEFDLGARADTHAYDNRFTMTLALLNGRTIGEQAGSAVPDLNRGKDGVARIHYDTGAVGFGMSGYLGVGQRVDPVGLRFKQYPRWAAGAEFELHHVFHEALGQTRAVFEGTLAANMDRGLVYPFALPDIPDDLKSNVDARNEASASLRVEQDTTKWLTWAFRFDAYTPSTRLPDNVRITGSIATVLHVTRHLRFILEYDHARDTIRPDGDAAKPFRHVSQGSVMMEARF
jgi:hypothetical protein